MSHQTRLGPEWLANHNGDFSGPVELLQIEPGTENVVHRIEVPFDVLKELVGEYVRDERISEIENVDDLTDEERAAAIARWEQAEPDELFRLNV